MRTLIAALLLLNALFFAWSRGWLDDITGLPAQSGREPQRVTKQVHPERIELLDAKATAALSERSCLELGPLDGDTALAAAQNALRASNLASSEWLTRTQDVPGAFVVATIKLDNPEFRARKEATYKQLRIETEPLAGLPAEQPSLVLSRHATQAEAQAELAKLDARGLKGLRVLTLQAPSRQHSLVIREADGLLAAKLKGLKDPALGAGFKACSAASQAMLSGLPASAPSASAPGR